jgi:hypothetical protein
MRQRQHRVITAAVGRVSVIEQLEGRRMLSVAEPNNSLATAVIVDAPGGFAGQQTFADVVNNADPVDYYRLNIPTTDFAKQSDLTVRLYNLSADLNVALVNDANNNGTEDAGEVVASSTKTGTQEDSFSDFLSRYRGPFFIKVLQAAAGNQSPYVLDLYNDAADDKIGPLARWLHGTGTHTITEGLNNTNDLQDLYFFPDLGTERGGRTTFSVRLESANPGNYHVDLLQDQSLNDTLVLLTTSHLLNGAQEIQNLTLPTVSNGYFYLRVLHSAPATDNYTLTTFSDWAGSTITTARDTNGGVDGRVQTFTDEVGTASGVTKLDPTDFYKLQVRDPGTAIDAIVTLDPGQSTSTFSLKEELIRDANNNGVVDAGEVITSASTNTGAGGQRAKIARSVAPGTYYLRVTGGPAADYTLDVQGDTAAPFNGEAPRYSTAKNLGTLAGQAYAGDAMTDGDADAYRFTLSRAAHVRFEITGYPMTAALLVDSNHDDVMNFGTAEQLGTFQESSPLTKDLPAGTYAIYTEFAGQASNYYITFTIDAAGNTAQTALDLGTLGAFSGVDDFVSNNNFFGTDVDFYKFRLASTATFTATLLADIGGDTRNVTLDLYQDNGGGSLSLVQEVISTGYSLLQRSLAAGNYQIKMSAAPTASANYQLGLSTGDNDDSIPEAKINRNNQKNPGDFADFTLSSGTDVDMVQVYIEAPSDKPETVAFDLDSRNGSNVNTVLRLFDAAGHQLAANDDGAAPGETSSGFSYLTYNFPAGTDQAYYVGVSSAGNAAYNPLTGGGDATGTSSGQYRLNISDVVAPLATGSIRGTVINDVNGNGVKDSIDSGIAGRTVWLDTDLDGVLDSSETRTTTDSSGNYTFSNLAAGAYKVREIRPAGWTQVLPSNNFGLNVTLAAGQNVTGKSFFIRSTPAGTASIAGSVFHDFNRNGVKDSGDTGIGSWLVWVDTDLDGVLDTNEQRMLTDGSGNYKFINLAAGTYKVREMLQSGFVQTTPSNNFGNNATLAAGQPITGKNFGVDN